MAQACNLPISEFRPLRADYTVGFQSILAYRVTLCLQNKTQLRFSCNFLEPLRNPNSRFGQYFIHPLLDSKPKAHKLGPKADRPLGEPKEAPSADRESHSPGNSPRLTPIFPFPQSNVTDTRGSARGARTPSTPPGPQGLPSARPGRRPPGFSVPKEGNRAPSGLCGGLRR